MPWDVNSYSKMTLRPRVIRDSSKAECFVYSINEVQYPHTPVVDVAKNVQGFTVARVLVGSLHTC